MSGRDAAANRAALRDSGPTHRHDGDGAARVMQDGVHHRPQAQPEPALDRMTRNHYKAGPQGHPRRQEPFLRRPPGRQGLARPGPDRPSPRRVRRSPRGAISLKDYIASSRGYAGTSFPTWVLSRSTPFARKSCVTGRSGWRRTSVRPPSVWFGRRSPASSRLRSRTVASDATPAGPARSALRPPHPAGSKRGRRNGCRPYGRHCRTATSSLSLSARALGSDRARHSGSPRTTSTSRRKSSTSGGRSRWCGRSCVSRFPRGARSGTCRCRPAWPGPSNSTWSSSRRCRSRCPGTTSEPVERGQLPTAGPKSQRSPRDAAAPHPGPLSSRSDGMWRHPHIKYPGRSRSAPRSSSAARRDPRNPG